jgi:hypothetical protein
MSFHALAGSIELLCGVTFLLACLGVLIAVIGKAARKFPYQPDEYKAFTRPLLPRRFSKIYVVKPPPRPRKGGGKNQRHENSYPQRARRHGG